MKSKINEFISPDKRAMSKTIIKKLTAIAILGMLVVSAAKANNYEKSENDSTKCMELTIKVKEDGMPLAGASITVYHHNKAIFVYSNDMLSDEAIDMVIDLKKNTYYIIEVSKPGYITKSVIVSTKLPKDVVIEGFGLYQHETTILLVKQDGKQNANNYRYAGGTVGIIYYDVVEDNFTGSFIVTEPQNDESILTMVQQMGY